MTSMMLLVSVIVAAMIKRRRNHHCGRLWEATCLIGPIWRVVHFAILLVTELQWNVGFQFNLFFSCLVKGLIWFKFFLVLLNEVIYVHTRHAREQQNKWLCWTVCLIAPKLSFFDWILDLISSEADETISDPLLFSFQNSETWARTSAPEQFSRCLRWPGEGRQCACAPWRHWFNAICQDAIGTHACTFSCCSFANEIGSRSRMRSIQLGSLRIGKCVQVNVPGCFTIL